MSIFGSIMNKIFHHGGSAQPASAGAPEAATGAGSGPSTPASASPTMPQSASSAAPSQPVDVEAVLTQMASQKGGGGNWQTSIVDLLKLLDLDSSLDARKQLAGEVNVHAGADGSAEQNVALHRAVMQKLAENGGKVPDSLRG